MTTPNTNSDEFTRLDESLSYLEEVTQRANVTAEIKRAFQVVRVRAYWVGERSSLMLLWGNRGVSQYLFTLVGAENLEGRVFLLIWNMGGQYQFCMTVMKVLAFTKLLFWWFSRRLRRFQGTPDRITDCIKFITEVSTGEKLRVAIGYAENFLGNCNPELPVFTLSYGSRR